MPLTSARQHPENQNEIGPAIRSPGWVVVQRRPIYVITRQLGDIINIARLYGREMHVLTVLQRAGNIEPITLNVLSTIGGRLKGKGGSTFGWLTTNLFAEPPTVVAYGEMAKKKATAYGVKVKDILAFAPDWEYDGQDGMATVKDYQLIPTKG